MHETIPAELDGLFNLRKQRQPDLPGGDPGNVLVWTKYGYMPTAVLKVIPVWSGTEAAVVCDVEYRMHDTDELVRNDRNVYCKSPGVEALSEAADVLM